MIYLPEQQSHSWVTAMNCRGTPSKETIDWAEQRMMRRKGRERRGREEEWKEENLVILLGLYCLLQVIAKACLWAYMTGIRWHEKTCNFVPYGYIKLSFQWCREWCFACIDSHEIKSKIHNHMGLVQWCSGKALRVIRELGFKSQIGQIS